MYYSVDKMEHGIAELLDDEGNVKVVEASFLPAGVREGDVVYYEENRYTAAPYETERRRKETQEILKRLLGDGGEE